jgi:hypothetical protein
MRINVRLSVCPSARLPVCLSARLSVCPCHARGSVSTRARRAQERVGAPAAVLNEVLFGASDAWRDRGALATPLVDGARRARELVSLAAMVLSEYVQEQRWGAPTHSEAAAGSSLTPQV